MKHLDMDLDGKQIVFVRADNTPTEFAVFRNENKETGELMFFELMGYTDSMEDIDVRTITNNRRPLINSKEPFKRLFVRRCFPAIRID